MTYQMEVNGIEKDFLEQIREARAEDIRTIVEYLHKLKKREDRKGRLTTVAILTAAITEELILNGMVKWHNIEECD